MDWSTRSSIELRVCFRHFWPGFNPTNSFVGYLIGLSFDNWIVCLSEKEADIIFSSVFPHKNTEFPEKTVAIIWENVRPNYSLYSYSISSDLDNYEGRNIRLPLWVAELAWPRFDAPDSHCEGAHGNEPLVDIDLLLSPRSAAYVDRPKFCGHVASNAEPFRMMAARALSAIGPVDLYGRIAGKTEPWSKYEILKPHKFSLCFENSLFPGYHTEKLLQAYAAGTIPLYFGTASVSGDFNSRAFINRLDFDDNEGIRE